MSRERRERESGRGVALDEVAARLAAERLAIFGALHPEPDEGAPPGTGTLVLIGPLEPGYWAHLTASPEWRDGRPDPVDRWSRRVIGRLACDLGAKAVFPFTGPPFAPFPAWARRSGTAWQSPVGLLVQAQAGLMVSYRGALALRPRYDLPAARPSPCESCPDQPCRSACPVAALRPDAYDVAGCRAHLAQAAGQACLRLGCAARRACPLSVSYGRVGEHSAYHMRHFRS